MSYFVTDTFYTKMFKMYLFTILSSFCKTRQNIQTQIDMRRVTTTSCLFLFSLNKRIKLNYSAPTGITAPLYVSLIKSAISFDCKTSTKVLISGRFSSPERTATTFA